MVLCAAPPGEFGIVYKATLAPNDTIEPEVRVAVKTLKGTKHIRDILVHILNQFMVHELVSELQYNCKLLVDME